METFGSNDNQFADDEIRLLTILAKEGKESLAYKGWRQIVDYWYTKKDIEGLIKKLESLEAAADERDETAHVDSREITSGKLSYDELFKGG